MTGENAIPFEAFSDFERVPSASPLFACAPPDWAAAAHAIVAADVVHYIWAQKRTDNTWVLMHSHAPTSDPSAVEHDPRHPIVVPAEEGAFDDHTVYTGEAKGLGGEDRPYNNPTLCHATAPVGDPGEVTKDSANPVFRGSGADWDKYGVREAEILKGPHYFHIFYGGYNGKIWQIGHVRTRDFRTFEPNPANPILTPNEDPEAWGSGELLTPHVFAMNGDYYMLYAGLKGRGWGGNSACGSGLAVARR